MHENAGLLVVEHKQPQFIHRCYSSHFYISSSVKPEKEFLCFYFFLITYHNQLLTYKVLIMVRVLNGEWLI